MPDQPENVVAFVQPKRTTLPYPVQVVADALPLQQIDDMEDQLQFTIIDWELGHPPTFCLARAEVSVSGLAIAYCKTMKRFYSKLLKWTDAGQLEQPFESMPQTQEA